MKELVKNYLINAHPADVWRALTDCDEIEKWGGGPCQMEASENFEFSLWDGDIYGRNLEVIAGQKLVQEWFAGKWSQPSIATFTLNESSNGTELKLVHADIPDNEFASIDSGWDDHYLGPLKESVEKL